MLEFLCLAVFANLFYVKLNSLTTTRLGKGVHKKVISKVQLYNANKFLCWKNMACECLTSAKFEQTKF